MALPRTGAGRRDDGSDRQLAKRPVRRRHAADEPVVVAALEVVRRAERPSPPSRPCRCSTSRRSRTGCARSAARASRCFRRRVRHAVRDRRPAAEAHRVLDAYAEIGGNTIEVIDNVSGRQEEVVGTWLARGAGGSAPCCWRVWGWRPSIRGRPRRRSPRRSTGCGPGSGPSGSTCSPSPCTTGRRASRRPSSRSRRCRVRPRRGRRGRRAQRRTADQARVAAGQRGLPRFVAVSPVYSALERAAYEADLAPIVVAQGLGCLPRSPLAGGFLTGASATRAAASGCKELDPERADRLSRAGTKRGLKVVEAIAALARERAVPTSAVALAGCSPGRPSSRRSSARRRRGRCRRSLRRRRCASRRPRSRRWTAPRRGRPAQAAEASARTVRAAHEGQVAAMTSPA